jgi:hypothetical protein
VEDEFLSNGRESVSVHLLFLSKQKLEKYNDGVNRNFCPKIGDCESGPSLAMLAQVDLGSARLSRVGFGVTPKQASLK